MRRPGLNHLHILRLQDPFDTNTHIHKPQAALQHMQHSPSTGGQRMFPLQRLWYRALRKVERAAAGTKPGWKFPLRHNYTSIIVHTFIIAGDPSCNEPIIAPDCVPLPHPIPRSS